MGEVRIAPAGIRDNPPKAAPKTEKNYSEVKVAPFSDRLDQLERFYAANRDQARQACKGKSVAPLVLSTVLRVLVSRTDASTGQVCETLTQIAAGGLELSTGQVKRALAVLRDLGWVETLAGPVSPGRNGGQGKPTVSRVTFLRARTEPVLVNSDPAAAPVDNAVLGARLGAPPFPVDNAGMGARESVLGARLGAPPHGLEPRFVETVCGETLIGTDSTPATDHQPNLERDGWVTGLASIARGRPGRNSPRARAEVMTYAAAMYAEYGHLTLLDHGSRLADYLIAKTREERIDPALLDYLANASTGALEGRCEPVTVAAGGAR